MIPAFHSYLENQSNEENITQLLQFIIDDINKIEILPIMPKDEIEKMILNVHKCKKSFWLNSIDSDIVKQIEILRIELEDYQNYRKLPGGLLQIMKWKNKNKVMLKNLLKSIDNGKF